MKKHFFLLPILLIFLITSACSTKLEVCFGASITGRSVEFNATCSVGGPVAYSWDFGDGSKSTQAGPTHDYSSSGTYTIVLTIENKQGKTAEGSRTITI